MSDEYEFGALPPEGCEWEIGRTAASISFVADAETYIANHPSESENNDRLKKEIERVKSGDVELRDWLTPEVFLERGEKKDVQNEK